MDGRANYVLEKLRIAMEELATGPGDVRQRLHDAYMGFHPIKEDDCPEHLRADWRWVLAQLPRFGPIPDHEGKVRVGSVANTMQRIHNSTGVKIATKIVHLYHELDAHVNPR
jgi:hypothetical protein